MIPRTAILLIAVALGTGGCSRGGAPEGGPGKAEQVACALNGAEIFADACTLERKAEGDRTILLVRHPDGGFRRFAAVAGEPGLAVADGAEQATVELVDGMLDVAVGKDHYLLPATLNNPAKPDKDAPQP